MSATRVLKPGFLVSLKTNVRGGIEYQRTDLEPDHFDDEGKRVAKWETSRQIHDPQEFERAQQARTQARIAITKVCSRSSFGLLCPLDRESDLTEAIATARAIADEHNRSAQVTRVEVYTLVGRIAHDDAEAARAISAEVRSLLDAMRDGIKAADPDAVRDAANRARALDQMLSSDVAKSVSQAIKEARSAASEIAKRVVKAGERAAEVVAEFTLKRIEAARFAVLDMDDLAAVETQAPTGRDVDLDPDSAPPQMSALQQPTYRFEV